MLIMEHLSRFKTASLVIKFLYSGYPKYCVTFLKPRHSVYNTRKSQADGVFLEVPHFAPLAYKSSKHFGLSFAYMLQRFGMICLMMYVQPLLSTHSERSSKSLCTSISSPNFSFSRFLSMALTPTMSQVNDYSFLLFLFGAPRVHL